MPAIEHGAKVNGNEVSLTDHPLTRYAVDELIVDRNARDPREGNTILSSIPEEVRLCSCRREHLTSDSINLRSGDSGDSRILHPAQALSHDQPSRTHLA